MGKLITLICDETPGLKLGPGDPGQLIVFDRGYAEFDEEEYPKWRKWVEAPGTPHIEVIEAGPPA